MAKLAFQRRGIVEGFFGPPWSMRHRKAVFAFGAKRGMNTYLYAPKDDPYHRKLWRKPYPRAEWRALSHLMRAARDERIDFVYGFHPGKGLRFSAPEPVEVLLEKAARFHDAGVRTFAVLFDDIPSRLAHATDRKVFNGSLARAEALWMEKILERQPASWKDVEWWICPSRYTEHSLLERMFGAFEARFWETFARHLPECVPCLWTGPAIVPPTISLAHARKVARELRHPLILWDNYPVNDLYMSGELHIAPLTGRDARLPEAVYGYLNNPLLQERLGLLPLATCFDYTADPAAYDAEKSWEEAVRELFGASALPHWRAIRAFCKRDGRLRPPCESMKGSQRAALQDAYSYVLRNRGRRWFEEFQPWLVQLERRLKR